MSAPKLYYIYFLMTIVFSSNGLSQDEPMIWYFGDKAGINFNTNPPTPLTDGQLSTSEGCGVVTNKSGELLFYTDGVSVWNKQHSILQNGTGLNGKMSAAQNGLCIRQPGSNRYYIFSVPEVESSDKSCYFSIVDMNLDNGLGAVTEKNTRFDDLSTEKIAATKHCNGDDIWIILHGQGTVYKAYLLNGDSLSKTPVLSNGAMQFVVNSWDASGYMKVSANGKKIATCHRQTGAVELADFNNAMGIVSNAAPIYFSMMTYGVEFASNQSFLYVSCGTSQNNGELFQVDLRVGMKYLTKTKIAQNSTHWFGALQIAPDHKIYMAYMNKTNLGVINSPTQAGAASNFVLNGFDLAGRQSKLGLPGFCQSYIPTPKNRWADIRICAGASAKLVNQYPEENSYYEWSPATGLNSTNVSDPIVTLEVSQKYRVIVRTTGCLIDTAFVEVTVLERPTCDAGKDTTICLGKSVVLGSNVNQGFTCEWSPLIYLSNRNSPTPLCKPLKSTRYILTTKNSYGCIRKDTVLVEVENLPIDAGKDTIICKGSSIQLTGTGADTYEWTPNSNISNPKIENPTVKPQKTTKYYLRGTKNGCEGIDSITVFIDDPPILSLTNDTTVCMGNSVKLNVKGAKTYRWEPDLFLNSSNIPNPISTPQRTITYYVYGSNNGCVALDSVTIVVSSSISITLPDTLKICEGTSATINAEGGDKYVWSPSEGLNNSHISNPIATPKKTTKYYVTVHKGECVITDSIYIIVTPKPIIKASNDTSICQGTTVQLQVEGAEEYLWSPSIGLSDTTIHNPIASPDVTTKYIVKASRNNCITFDTILITVNSSLSLNLADTISICAGESAQLSISGADSYIWFPSKGLNKDSIANPIATPEKSIMYYVQGRKGNCLSIDSIYIIVKEKPQISLTKDTVICYGVQVQLEAKGAYSYSWFPSDNLDNPTIANPIAAPTKNTMYYVECSQNGCTVLDSVLITVNDSFNIQLDDSITICHGTSVQLNASGAQEYVWTPQIYINDPHISNPIVSPPETTTYFVHGKNNECDILDSIIVVVNDSVNVKISDSVTICKGESVTLNADGAETYVWHPKEGLNNQHIKTPIASPQVTTEYTLIGTKGHCTSTKKVKVTVIEPTHYKFSLSNSEERDFTVGENVVYSFSTPDGLDSIRYSIKYDPTCLEFISIAPINNSINLENHNNGLLDLLSLSPLLNGTTGSVRFKVLLPPHVPQFTTVTILAPTYIKQCNIITAEQENLNYAPSCAWDLRGVFGSDKFSIDIVGKSIIVHSGLGGGLLLSIFSINGDRIWENELETMSSKTYDISIPELPNGVYIVNTKSGVWNSSTLLHYLK